MKFLLISNLLLISSVLLKTQNSFKILDIEINTSSERIDKIINIYFGEKEKINTRLSKDFFLKFLIDKNSKEIFLLRKNDKENKNLKKYKIIEEIILEFLTQKRIFFLRKKKARKILESEKTYLSFNNILERRKKLEKIKKSVFKENISGNENKKDFKTNEL